MNAIHALSQLSYVPKEISNSGFQIPDLKSAKIEFIENNEKRQVIC
jgi:hypothetical protein